MKHPLAPFRGIINAILLSSPFWAAVIYGAVKAWTN